MLFALVLSFVQTFTWFDRVGWDTVSYLDLAQAFKQGDFELALSPYWSPLYPMLYAITSTILPSVPERISLSLHQYLCFLFFAVTSFYFWKTVVKTHQYLAERDCIPALPTLPLCFFAASVSSYASLVVGDVMVKSPDMLAGALFLFANGLVLSMVHRAAPRWQLLLTGVVMGSSYLAKSFFISWILPCLVLLVWQRKTFHLNFKKLALIAASALLMVALYAVPLSVRCGHPTISEAGQYQFVFCTIPLVEGTHEAPKLVTQAPKHPTRIFFENPRVYEFAEPFDVTYSPWFNPHYWNEGAKAYVDFKIRYDLMRAHIELIAFHLGGLALFMMVYIACLNRSIFCFSWARISMLSPIVLTNMLCLILFILITVQQRYLSGHVPVLFAALILTCRHPVGSAGVKPCARMLWATSSLMLLALFLSSTLQFYFAIPELRAILTKSVGVKLPEKPSDQHGATAAKLAELGVKPGDRVARISLFELGEFYWARSARVKIVCESVDANGFFKTPEENRKRLYDKLRAFGVKAIVLDWTYRPPPSPTPTEDGWIPVDQTSNFVKILSQ